MSWRSPGRWDNSPGWNFPPPDMHSTPRRPSPRHPPFRSPVSADRYLPYRTPPSGGYRPKEHFQSYSEKPFKNQHNFSHNRQNFARPRGQYFQKDMLENPWTELERDFDEYKEHLFAEADNLSNRIPSFLSRVTQKKTSVPTQEAAKSTIKPPQPAARPVVQPAAQPVYPETANFIPLFSGVTSTASDNVDMASPVTEFNDKDVSGLAKSDVSVGSPNGQLLPPSTFDKVADSPGTGTAPSGASHSGVTPSFVPPQFTPTQVKINNVSSPLTTSPMVPSMFNPLSTPGVQASPGVIDSPPVIASSISSTTQVVCPVAVNVTNTNASSEEK